LRALQTETGEHLTNHLSWVPYLITLAGCSVVVGFALYAIGAEKRRSERRKRLRQAEDRAKAAAS
jgi:hypothetical protein